MKFAAIAILILASCRCAIVQRPPCQNRNTPGSSNDGCPINCSTIQNTNGPNGKQGCLCIPGYSWSSTQRKCLIQRPALVNCLVVPYALGTGTSGNCFCENGYVFTGQFCVLDCSNIAHSTGAAYSLDSCVCSAGYTWAGDSCQLACLSKLKVTGVDPKTGNCQCEDPYYWDGAECSMNCPGYNNINGQIKYDSCHCAKGYKWVQ